MNKQLRFTYNNKEYVLEYTRKSVEAMEKKGFIASDIETKPVTILPALFAGAFLAPSLDDRIQALQNLGTSAFA